MWRHTLAGALLAAVVSVPGAPELVAQSSSSPDFLFSRPGISLTLRGGAFLPRGQSGVFDFAVERLTVDRSDFRGGSLGAEFGIWVGDRLEV